MSKMFRFDGVSYARQFAESGFVHIPQGLTEEFYRRLVDYVEESFSISQNKEFAVGDKQQAVFEFIEPEHYDELRKTVAAVCNVAPDSLSLSERHIKQYESGAAAHPLAHKDRFGSEVAVGFSIHVPEGSTLVIYPDHDVSANPFNSTAELRSSFSQDRAPEPGLATADRVEIRDRPRDVMMFHGSAMWHLREHSAGTTVLYLKLNTYNCDTLGEDPETANLRSRTARLAQSPRSAWAASIPVISRQVEYVEHRYNRDWKEVIGVTARGKPFATITTDELFLLRAMNGQQTVANIARHVDQGDGREHVEETIRRLAESGIVDLLNQSISMGGIHSQLAVKVSGAVHPNMSEQTSIAHPLAADDVSAG